MKTLLIRSGGLGDTLLSLFTAKWLSSAHGHEVTMMIQRRHAEIPDLFGFNVIVEEDSDFQSAYHIPSQRLTDVLRAFELVVAIKKDAGQLRDAVNGNYARIEPLPPQDYALPYPLFLIHEAAHALGLNPPDNLPTLDSAIQWTKPHTKHLAFAIGSGSTAKNWPAANYLRLMNMARVKGCDEFTAIIGPAEIERTPESVELFESNGAKVIIAPSITNLATALSNASVYVGADCGVTHLSALIGVPAIALFGPTDPRVWGPLGSDVSVIRSISGRMEDIAVESVIRMFRSAS